MTTPAPQFLNVAPAVAADPAAPYVVLPLPYERTVSYGTGTREGPAAILRASLAVEDFDEELCLPVDLAVQTLPALALADLSEDDAMQAIGTAAADELNRHRFLLSLGGEHSVTSPLVGAAVQACGARSVLQLDAHTDLRDVYGGTPLSHGCPMRRCRELGVQTVHAGIRSCSVEEYDYIRQESVPVFWAREMLADPHEDWIDAICRKLTSPVYVTVDIDVFDPSVVPGTGTPEPGGLSWGQVSRLLRAVYSRCTVVAADLVEVAPVPGTQVSEFVAARLGARMLMYHRHPEA